MASRTGSCSCGAVQYRLASAPMFVHCCHCRDCQRQTGTAFVLNALIVTPRMHGIHHSEIEGEANSNYSVVFSFWDRLHRSLCLGVPQAEVRVGVPAYREPGDERLLRALSLPFRRQRDYWLRPDGTRPERQATERRSRLAE